MSGGEPSSIKRKPSCAAELPILSPNRGKAAGRTLSNRPRAVLWGAEQFSMETTVSIEWDVPGGCPDTSERDKSSDGRNFCPSGIKTHVHGPDRFLLAFGQFTLCRGF